MEKISFFQWVINYLENKNINVTIKDLKDIMWLDLKYLDNDELKEIFIIRKRSIADLVFVVFNWSKCNYMSDIPQIHLMNLDWKKYCLDNNIFKINDIDITLIPFKKLKINFDC